MIKILLAFLLCLVLSCEIFWAQGFQNFHFRTYQVDDGLSENTIYCIMQDSKGFLWFGTKDGLNRFDGTNFRIFRFDTKSKDSLGNNFVRSIHEGADGNTLYIGTDVGLYIMDVRNETFELMNIKDSDGELISTAVNSLIVDNKNRLWIGTMYQGVFTYDIETREVRKVDVYKQNLAQNAVWYIYQDQAGIVWVGTRIGLLRYNDSTRLLEPVDNLFKMQNNSDNEILTMHEDVHGNLWLGTWDKGIRLYNKHTNEFTAFCGTKDKSPYITHIRSLLRYSDDVLLVGSDDGLYFFNIKTQACSRIDVPNRKYSLSDQNVYSIIRDKEGGIWIGTYFGGVNYMSTSSFAIESFSPNGTFNSISGKAISQFCEDPDGNLWIATEDAGVNYFDTKTKRFSQPIKTSYHNTHALMLDGDDLWIGTFSRGIDIYNVKTRSLRNYQNKNGNTESLNDNCIFSLYKTRKGDIYVGTPVGLNRYIRETNSFEQVREVRGFIYDLKEDSYGNLWVATYGTGVVKLHAQSGKWLHYDAVLKSENPIVRSKLTSIHIDNQKKIWFTSEGRGIFCYNEVDDSFKNISEADGLPNNVVYGLLDDQYGNLWMSCNKGLVCFNPSLAHTYKLYNKQDGLQSNQFNYKSSFRSKDGKFYFGGINGFNSFYPQDVTRNINKQVPHIEITGIQVLGYSDKELQKEIRRGLNRHEVVRLPYDKSSITISYISLSFVSQAKNQYAYKLEGVDSEWNYAENTRSVTYVNLPPGKYIFKVKGSNNNDFWNEDGAEVMIEILPPFWMSLPAKIAYLIIMMVVAYYVIMFYLRKHELKQRKHLDAYKAEQETLAFKSKIDFFTTIAHEIRTPLSLIGAPLEDIIHSEDGNEETKQNLLVIEKNTNRLMVLINQLLDFRKMESTQYIINPERIDLRNFVQDLFERFKKTAQRKKIEMNLELSDSSYLEVVSDSDALTKIIGNLLTNALKYTSDAITLKLECESAGIFTIKVYDNGRGIPEDKKSLIFDPFYQISKSDENTGSGIGLSLVKHLTEVLNGTIVITDNVPSGSVFSFTFGNMAEEVESQMQVRKTIEQEEPEAEVMPPQETNRKSILVVDDNAEIVQFIKNSLQKEYLVYTALDAMQALEHLNIRTFDLIISDIMMPGVDGISFSRKIKRDLNFSHIPIILLSAKTENSVKIEGLRSGADVFIEKPFSMSYLKAQINSLLENRRAILDTFNQSPLASYSLLTTNKKDELFLTQLNEEIEKHLSDINFTIESITDIFSISRSNLQRKLKSICDMTPGDYLRNYRLKKACRLLLDDDLRINEVAFLVGFNSASYFTKAFLKQYGILPKDFVKKNTETKGS